MTVYLIDSKIEDRIRQISEKPLTSDERNRLMAAINSEVDTLPAFSPVPTVLTAYEIRRCLKRLTEIEFPRLAVLSY